jgi:hypothetical protein
MDRIRKTTMKKRRGAMQFLHSKSPLCFKFTCSDGSKCFLKKIKTLPDKESKAKRRISPLTGDIRLIPAAGLLDLCLILKSAFSSFDNGYRAFRVAITVKVAVRDFSPCFPFHKPFGLTASHFVSTSYTQKQEYFLWRFSIFRISWQ